MKTSYRAIAQRALNLLIDEIATSDLFDLQERYVDLFDRGRSLSLHLFEHVHGESCDRGQAMIDLLALYEKNGLTIGANELPDFIPLFPRVSGDAADQRGLRTDRSDRAHPVGSGGAAGATWIFL